MFEVSVLKNQPNVSDRCRLVHRNKFYELVCASTLTLAAARFVARLSRHRVAK
jgi:hypothetical protein